jgi:hypothetical protein
LTVLVWYRNVISLTTTQGEKMKALMVISLFGILAVSQAASASATGEPQKVPQRNAAASFDDLSPLHPVVGPQYSK